MKHLTTLKRAEVVVLYNQNIPFKEIARRLMISRNTVKLWVRRYVESGDIERRRPGPNPLTYTDASDRHRDIVARHNSDPSLATREIAAIHDVSLCTVRRHLKASNIHFYRTGWKDDKTHIKTQKRTEGTSQSFPDPAGSSQIVGTPTLPPNSATQNVTDDLKPTVSPSTSSCKREFPEIDDTEDEDTYEAFTEPPADWSTPSPIVFEVPTLIKEEVKKSKPKRKKGTASLLRCGVCLRTIDGKRFLCLQCPGAMVCDSCERRKLHESHTILRIPSTEAFEKLKHLIEKMQLDVAAALAGRPRDTRHVAKQEGAAPAFSATTTTQPKLRTYTNTMKDAAVSLLVPNNNTSPAANAIPGKAKSVEHQRSRTFSGHKRAVVENKKDQTKRTKERKESIDKDGNIEPLIYNPDEELFATINPERDPLFSAVDRTKKRKKSKDKYVNVQPMIYNPEENQFATVTVKAEPDPLFGIEDDLPLKRLAPDIASSRRGDGSSGDPVGAPAVEVKDEP